MCFLPERLRGIPIDDLQPDSVEICMEVIVDEDHDAASTSHNFLEQGEGVFLCILDNCGGGLIMIDINTDFLLLLNYSWQCQCACFLWLDGVHRFGSNRGFDGHLLVSTPSAVLHT